MTVQSIQYFDHYTNFPFFQFHLDIQQFRIHASFHFRKHLRIPYYFSDIKFLGHDTVHFEIHLHIQYHQIDKISHEFQIYHFPNNQNILQICTAQFLPENYKIININILEFGKIYQNIICFCVLDKKILVVAPYILQCED